MKLKVALVKNEREGYSIFVPSLKGCVSQGKTKEEALHNIKEAITLFLEEIDDDAMIEAEIFDEVSI